MGNHLSLDRCRNGTQMSSSATVRRPAANPLHWRTCLPFFATTSFQSWRGATRTCCQQHRNSQMRVSQTPSMAPLPDTDTLVTSPLHKQLMLRVPGSIARPLPRCLLDTSVLIDLSAHLGWRAVACALRACSLLVQRGASATACVHTRSQIHSMPRRAS